MTTRIAISFEFFPPKTDKGLANLVTTARRLAGFRPSMMTVTCGAGGSTRDTTPATIRSIKRATGLAVAAHLTCAGLPRSVIDGIAREYWRDGIRNIVALRGDPPGGLDKDYVPHPDGYAYSSDLVSGLRAIGDFDISVSAYPEVHPQARDAAADLDALRKKQDAGAHRAITQFFFDNADFLRFRDRAVAAGVTLPLVPGMMPIANFQKVAGFAAGCGARIPVALAGLFDGVAGDDPRHPMIAAVYAADQCRGLIAEGVDRFHFYTMNKPDLTGAVCRLIGLPEDQQAPPTRAAA